MAYCDVDGVCDPTWDLACEHSELETYDLRRVEIVVLEEVLHRAKGTHLNVTNIEPLSKSAKGALLTVALEDEVVVPFAAVEDLLEGVEVVIVEVEIEDIVVPEGLGPGGVEGDSLPDSILEADNKIFSDEAQVAIEVEALRQTFIFVI